ncbi:MAG: hypothetical protein ACXADY_15085 [Candidatus Hodarchaeales archaeon]
MSINYFDCDGCGRTRIRIEDEYPIDAKSYCPLCAIEKVWYSTVKQSKDSTNSLDREDAYTVLKEHSIFTDQHPHLRAFETAVRAMSQLLQFSIDGRIKIEDMEEFMKKYKKPFDTEILPVLKTSGIIIDFDEELIHPSELLHEIIDDFNAKKPDIAIKKLDGLVSIAILSEAKYRSKLRRIFLEAVKNECLDSDGNIKSTELTDKTLMKVTQYTGASEKQIMNQRLKMLKYDFFFESRKTATKEIIDPNTGKKKKIRSWTVKEPWVRTISKVLVRLREIERERVLVRKS